MRKAGSRRDVAATAWSTSPTPNRSANPSRPSPARYSGARAQCSRRNRSGSPTQRRRALPVGAVGIAANAAVGAVDAVAAVGTVGAVGAVHPVGPVGAVDAVGPVGAVRIRPVGVAAAGVDAVHRVAARAGGAALRGGDVVVSE